MPLCSCGCNYTEEVNLTGVCIDKDTLLTVKDLDVSGGSPCGYSITAYTDDTGTFHLSQCFEEDEDGNTFSYTIGSARLSYYYIVINGYYKYHKGKSVIDLGTIEMEPRP